jgi:hypothetical protein
LRQKLDEYYRTEGQEDELLIVLPKGHFRLEFRPRQAEVPAGSPPVARPVRNRWIVAAVLAAFIGLTAGWEMRAYLAPGTHAVPAPWTAEMQELWRPFLDDSRPIMLAIGTPLFVKVGNSFFRDPALNTWDAVTESNRVRELEKILEGSSAFPAFPYTGVGEASAAFELSRLFLPRGKDLSLGQSNLLTWEDISHYNMIFLGPPKSNLQTKDLPVQQDFEIGHSRVQNLHPRAGEPRQYEEKWTPDRSRLEEGHALITRTPGLHNNGQVLILAGSSTECTRAAVEFVTRPEYVTPFVRWMRQTHGGIPPWFQVVIRAKLKSQTPIVIERVAFHALK